LCCAVIPQAIKKFHVAPRCPKNFPVSNTSRYWSGNHALCSFGKSTHSRLDQLLKCCDHLVCLLGILQKFYQIMGSFDCSFVIRIKRGKRIEIINKYSLFIWLHIPSNSLRKNVLCISCSSGPPVHWFQGNPESGVVAGFFHMASHAPVHPRDV
jgi:hypothetical protein